MKIIFKLKNLFSVKTTDIKYYLVEVMPRAIYENSNRGGVRITIKFQKTVTRFGKSNVLTDVVTFNNYHAAERDAYGDRIFTYNPPYVRSEDSHSEDAIWHSIMVWRDCESYPFAPITTHQLNLWIDEWAMNHTCFVCPCGHKQSAHKEKEIVKCPACNKNVGVPPHNGSAFF